MTTSMGITLKMVYNSTTINLETESYSGTHCFIDNNSTISDEILIPKYSSILPFDTFDMLFSLQILINCVFALETTE